MRVMLIPGLILVLGFSNAATAFTGAVARYAHVGAGGAIDYGHGIQSSMRLGEGSYVIAFSRDISHCAFNVTSDHLGIYQISVAPAGPNTVEVQFRERVNE